jgi:tetratricopeptide (TPR) repeat protein
MKRPARRRAEPTREQPLAEAPAEAPDRRVLWISLALAALVLFIYAPVWNYNFVTFDDPEYVTLNPYIAQGLTWSGIAWAFTAGYLSYWHPLTWLAHMLDIQLFGMNAGLHHATNVLLHIANSVLLFLFLRRFTGSLWPSAFAAALFATHPLRVESVAWIAERKDVLSTLFWMFTMWAYLEYVRKPAPARYAAVVLLFAAGLMSKPMLVTLPFVLLLLDLWDRPSQFVAGLATLIKQKLPLFALTIISSVITYQVQRQVGAVATLDALSLPLRIGNAIVSYAAYIGKAVWPIRLAVLYPFLPLEAWTVAQAAILLAVISAAVWRAHRTYLVVGWLWFLGTLVPTIGLVQVGGQAMADRFTYVPLIGIFIMIAWGAAELSAKWRVSRAVMAAAATVVLLACTVTARAQVGYWSDSAALWEHTLAVTAENYRAHNNLGFYFANENRLPEAIAHFTEALRIRPDFAEGHSNLGAALARQGRMDEAIANYRAALTADPEMADAHNNLGVALAGQGKTDEAIHEFLETLRIHPNDANAHANVAMMLSDQGKTAEAREHFTAALRLNPNHEQARQGLESLSHIRPKE